MGVLMKGILRMSEAASMAYHALAVLAGGGGARRTTSEIAREISGSEAHLAKVMRRLVRHGIVQSSRGPGGGFGMAKSPDKISLLEIYEAVEGPFETSACLMDDPCCEENDCIMSSLIRAVNLEVLEFFRTRKLSDFAESCRLGREAC
jgi:Rrf2 family nitric oxide-sensitive transcriptional repressor